MSIGRSLAAGICCIVTLLSDGARAACGAEFVGGALRFEAPAIVGINELTRAPDGMPFAGDALGVDCHTDANVHGFGWLRIQFIWSGLPVADGSRSKVSLETTNEFLEFVRKLQSQSPRAMTLATFQGLPSITIKSTNSAPKERFHEATFVQVKTNIMLRMTVSAETEAVFAALSASLSTVRIDPQKLYEFIRPREPQTTIVESAKVEIGFASLANQEVLAAIFRTKDSWWSIVGGGHGDQTMENEAFETLSRTLDELGNQASIRGTAVQATLEIHRTGDGPDELQRSISFRLGAGIRDQRGAQNDHSFYVAQLLNRNTPKGFRKVRALPFKVNLLIEDHSSRYPYKRCWCH